MIGLGNLISKGAAGSAGITSAAIGLVKMGKGKKMRKAAQSTFDKNKYEIPESARASLQSAQRQASEVGLAGQDVMEAQIGQSTAQGVGASQEVGTSSSDVLGMLSQLYGNQQAQQQNIGIQAAQQYQQNQSSLQGALGNMAGWEEQKWKYNVLYPYQQQMSAAGQMADQGATMFNSGVSAVAGTAASASNQSSAQSGLNAQYAQTAGAGNSAMGGASSYQDYAKNMQQPSFNSYISGK